MVYHFVVYLQQPDRSAVVHRVSSRYIVSQLLFPFELLLFLDISYSRYVALFSYGAVIQKDSVEEYDLLAKQGGGYPSFICWFKQTVNSIRQFHFVR